MTDLQKLASWCLEFLSKHPEYGKEVNSYFCLCRDEIEAGESEVNEIELCKSAILDLLTEEDD